MSWLRLLLAGLIGGCGVSQPEALELHEDPDANISRAAVRRREAVRSKMEWRRGQVADKLTSDAVAQAHCPSVRHWPTDVWLQGGPTFDRIAAVRSNADAIALAEHPVGGSLHYYEVLDEGSDRSWRWPSTSGCLVDAQHVHCGEWRSLAVLEEFITSHGLDRHPETLDANAWRHLVATLVDARQILVAPMVPQCLGEPPPPIAQQLEQAHVVITPGRASIVVALEGGAESMDSGSIDIVEVEIEKGVARVSRREVWANDDRERHLWGPNFNP